MLTNSDQPDDLNNAFDDKSVDVYIPLPFVYRSRKVTDDFLGLPKIPDVPNVEEVFAEQFNFGLPAATIVNKSAKSAFQVGLTHEEAVEIVNLHSHYYYMVIICARVPSSSISSERINEGALFNTMFDRRGADFYCLLKNTVLTEANIISVRPMRAPEYQNTCRMELYNNTSPNLLWPKAVKIIHNAVVQPTNSDKENTSPNPLKFFQPATTVLTDSAGSLTAGHK